LNCKGTKYARTWSIWVALLFYIISISLILHFHASHFVNAALEGTTIGKACSNGGPIVQSETIAISVNSTMLIDLILDIFFYLGINTLDDRLERIGQIIILVAPSSIILMAEHSPHFIFIMCCMHSIQVAGSLVPIYSLLTRLLPEIFTVAWTVLSFSCLAFNFCLSLSYFHSPLTAWYVVLVLVFGCSSQVIFSYMVYLWWRNLLERSKTKRITDLLQAISNDELCCFVYLIFADIVVVLLHVGFALEAELSWSNVSLSELLCGIYTLAGFAVMSSCVPNRVIQYLAMKQKTPTEVKSHCNSVYFA